MRTVGGPTTFGDWQNPIGHPVQVGRARAPWEAIHGNFNNFSRDGRLLVLSSGDAPTVDGWTGTRTFPQNAIRADLFNGSHQDVVMDNNAPFPFANGSMSGVYLGKGICNCSGGCTTCGGLPDNRQGITHLLNEATRVVDWSREDARVVLTGGVHYGRGSDAVRYDWARELQMLQLDHPVRAFLVDLPDGDFGGVVIERIPENETIPTPRPQPMAHQRPVRRQRGYAPNHGQIHGRPARELGYF